MPLARTGCIPPCASSRHESRRSLFTLPGNGAGPAAKGVFKNLNDTNDLEPLDQHPILDLLSDPSELMTSWSLMWVTVAGLSLTGRALWLYGEENGRDSLLPIPLTWVESTDTRRTVWNIRPGGTGTAVPVPGEYVAHFYMPDPADPYGALSPLVQAALAVETDNAIAQCQLQTFLQGIMPRVGIRVGKSAGINGDTRPTLTGLQRRQLIEMIRSAYAGVINANEPMIFDGQIEDVFKLSTSPSEMSYLESGASTKERVLQSWGISPILLGQVEGANRASATVADYNMVANTVNPIITMLSLTMTEWLGPLYAGPGERLRIWIEPAVAHDDEMHLKRWQAGAQAKVVTPNEYRRNVLNLPDIEGGDKLPESEPALPALPAASDATKPEAKPDTEQKIQVAPELTLNGAQIAAASAIVQSVADGKISRDSGVGQLMVLLNLTEDQAERVMGSVGESFVPTTPAEKAADELALMLDPTTNPYTLERLTDGEGRTVKTLVKATRTRRKSARKGS
jgi:phage portal protein BeeE